MTITGYVPDYQSLRKLILYTSRYPERTKIKYILNDATGIHITDRSLELLYTSEENITVLPVNRGHVFGTFDLDAEVWKLRNPEQSTLIKSTMDVVLYESIFLKWLDSFEMKPNHFYYLPSMSYEDLHTKYTKSDWWLPQTNFYISTGEFSVDAINTVTNEYNRIYDLHLKNPYPRPWEIYQLELDKKVKFDLEHTLKWVVEQSGLTPVNMLSDESFTKLQPFIDTSRYGNPSHEHIFFSELGVGHLHDLNQVITI
jgi:hypothetical protein